MSDDKLYSIREIARQLGLPESTIRYYRDSFSDYLTTIGTGRRRRYPEQAVAVLRFIAESYAHNRKRAEIEEHLAEQDHEALKAEPVTDLTWREHRGPSLSEEAIEKLLDGDRERRQAMWQMAREIVRLGEAIEHQQTMLGELAQLLADKSSRTLPPSPESPEKDDEPPLSDTDEEPQATTPEPDRDGRNEGQVSQHPEGAPIPERIEDETDLDAESLNRELAQLREQLSHERELVERLRKAKLEFERRTAQAEQRLGGDAGRGTREPKKAGLIRRFLGMD